MSINKFLEETPTTKVRVLATIGLIIGTGVVYLYHACSYRHPVTYQCYGWEPSMNWILFLSALAGVDVSQYFVKSFTGIKHAQVAASTAIAGVSIPEVEEDDPIQEVENDVTATSDVSEIHLVDEMKG